MNGENILKLKIVFILLDIFVSTKISSTCLPYKSVIFNFEFWVSDLNSTTLKIPKHFNF